MAVMTPTTGAVFIPEVWSAETLAAREEKLVLAQLVARYDEEVSAFGDLIHIPEVSNLVANAVTPGTDVVPQAPTETERTITINRYFESSFEIHDMLSLQSKYRLAESYRRKAGHALGKQLDVDLAGCAAGFSQIVGDNATAINDSNVLRAIQYLDDALVPEEDRVFVIKPVCKKQMMLVDKYIDASKVGYTLESSPIRGKFFGEVYAVRIFVSPNITVDTTTSPDTVRNMMFHKDALGLAVQKLVKWEQNRSPKGLSDIYIATSLWGYSELRDNHGVLFRATAETG